MGGSTGVPDAECSRINMRCDSQLDPWQLDPGDSSCVQALRLSMIGSANLEALVMQLFVGHLDTSENQGRKSVKSPRQLFSDLCGIALLEGTHSIESKIKRTGAVSDVMAAMSRDV